MRDIVVLGSLNADLVATVEKAPEAGQTITGKGFATYAGGKGANQAYAIGRLGGSVAMLGRVGDDIYGREQVSNLASAGVFVDRVRTTADAPTGTALIVVEATGQNRIVVIPGANGLSTAAEVEQDRDILSKASYGLFQLEIPLSAIVLGLRAVKAGGGVTILDPAPARVLSDVVLALVDVLTPNLSELSSLSGVELWDDSLQEDVVAACGVLLVRGVGCVIAKLGGRGALIVSSEAMLEVPARLVVAVDTTGAGDCFNGALAFGLNRGDAMEDAVRFACSAAALSVMRPGAQASMPDLEEVERFLEEGESVGSK